MIEGKTEEIMQQAGRHALDAYGTQTLDMTPGDWKIRPLIKQA